MNFNKNLNSTDDKYIIENEVDLKLDRILCYIKSINSKRKYSDIKNLTYNFIK